MADQTPKPVKPSPRRRLMGMGAIAAIVLIVLCLGFQWTDVALHPWARSLTGDPVLIGTWKGEMRMASGEVRPVALRLERNPYSSDACIGCPTFEGSAQVCRASGSPENYTIRGRASNWNGTRFYVDTAAAGERPPGTYTSLGRIRGEWDGADMVRLRLTPYDMVINADGSTTTTHTDGRGPDPELTVELIRAGTSPIACAN